MKLAELMETSHINEIFGLLNKIKLKDLYSGPLTIVHYKDDGSVDHLEWINVSFHDEHECDVYRSTSNNPDKQRKEQFVLVADLLHELNNPEKGTKVVKGKKSLADFKK